MGGRPVGVPATASLNRFQSDRPQILHDRLAVLQKSDQHVATCYHTSHFPIDVGSLKPAGSHQFCLCHASRHSVQRAAGRRQLSTDRLHHSRALTVALGIGGSHHSGVLGRPSSQDEFCTETLDRQARLGCRPLVIWPELINDQAQLSHQLFYSEISTKTGLQCELIDLKEELG